MNGLEIDLHSEKIAGIKLSSIYWTSHIKLEIHVI